MDRLKQWWNNDLSKWVKVAFLALAANGLPAFTILMTLPGMTERQFIAQYGFGISTLYTGLPPQLAAETIPAKIGLGEQNVRIFSSLSPADQEAYNHTLLGEHTDAAFAVALLLEPGDRG